MITDPHAAGSKSYIGEVMRQAVALEKSDPAVLSADVFWGNPFTDVPELGSQIVLTHTATDPDEVELIELCAVELANLMWEGREVMQASLIAPQVRVQLIGHL